MIRLSTERLFFGGVQAGLPTIEVNVMFDDLILICLI